MSRLPITEEVFVALFRQVATSTLRSTAAALREQIRDGVIGEADWEVAMYQMATVIAEMTPPELHDMVEQAVVTSGVSVEWAS